MSDIDIEKPTEASPARSVVTHRFRAIKEHLYSDLNGEAVILSLKNGKYYGVNSVGASIWTAIQLPVSFDSIQSVIMAEYEIDEATCRRSILTFLDELAREELVEISDE